MTRFLTDQKAFYMTTASLGMSNVSLMARESFSTVIKPCIKNTLSDLWKTVVNPTQSFFERKKGFWSSPADESNVCFFNRLTDRKSQREDWYKVTPYVAEFWCAVSNTGFIIAGIHQNSPELVFAGAASIVSHTIPKQWLLTVDKIGVLVALSKLAREYEIVINNPSVLVPIAALGVVNLMDVYFARVKGETWPHVVWHLSAAAVANYVLGFSPKK